MIACEFYLTTQTNLFALIYYPYAADKDKQQDKQTSEEDEIITILSSGDDDDDDDNDDDDDDDDNNGGSCWIKTKIQTHYQHCET